MSRAPGTSSRRRRGDDAPTELEAAVLGLVDRHGPCTAYAVRREFLDSPTTYWSGSAGAIYPLVSRLEERGLLTARHVPWGRSTKKEVSLTRAGRRALRRWLVPPLPTWAASHTVDPVRTRLHHLDALDPEDRLAFVDDAEAKVRLHLADVRGRLQCSNGDDPLFERLALRGVVLELEARSRWLGEVRREIEERGVAARG